jgi:hypothetical protein
MRILRNPEWKLATVPNILYSGSSDGLAVLDTATLTSTYRRGVVAYL